MCFSHYYLKRYQFDSPFLRSKLRVCLSLRRSGMEWSKGKDSNTGKTETNLCDKLFFWSYSDRQHHAKKIFPHVYRFINTFTDSLPLRTKWSNLNLFTIPEIAELVPNSVRNLTGFALASPRNHSDPCNNKLHCKPFAKSHYYCFSFNTTSFARFV